MEDAAIVKHRQSHYHHLATIPGIPIIIYHLTALPARRKLKIHRPSAATAMDDNNWMDATVTAIVVQPTTTTMTMTTAAHHLLAHSPVKSIDRWPIYGPLGTELPPLRRLTIAFRRWWARAATCPICATSRILNSKSTMSGRECQRRWLRSINRANRSRPTSNICN